MGSDYADERRHRETLEDQQGAELDYPLQQRAASYRASEIKQLSDPALKQAIERLARENERLLDMLALWVPGAQ